MHKELHIRDDIDRLYAWRNVWRRLASIEFFFILQTRESTCDTQSSSATNQGDNTVLVAQGGTATPGIDASIQGLKHYIKKEQRETNYNDQKQHRHHNDQQNNN